MHRRTSLTAAVMLMVSLVPASWAADMNVKLTLRSDRVGLFEFTGQLPESALDVSGRPSVTSLRPLVAQAQQALAKREGYAPHIYGGSSHQMTSSQSSRVVEVAVTDPRSGRLVHASRQPLRPRPLRPNRTRPAAPSLMRRTQVDAIEAAPAMESAQGPEQDFKFAGPDPEQAAGRVQSRSVAPFAASVGLGAKR